MCQDHAMDGILGTVLSTTFFVFVLFCFVLFSLCVFGNSNLITFTKAVHSRFFTIFHKTRKFFDDLSWLSVGHGGDTDGGSF